MPQKTVAEKARIKPGTTIAVINPVAAIVDSLGLHKDVRFVKPAQAQLIFLFAKSRADLESRMPGAVASLAPGAKLWVFFRKGSKTAGLDMNRDDVWAVAERLGMRPVSLLSVDETWSVFRLKRGA
jgi:hypothetical protein